MKRWCAGLLAALAMLPAAGAAADENGACGYRQDVTGDAYAITGSTDLRTSHISTARCRAVDDAWTLSLTCAHLLSASRDPAHFSGSLTFEIISDGRSSEGIDAPLDANDVALDIRSRDTITGYLVSRRHPSSGENGEVFGASYGLVRGAFDGRGARVLADLAYHGRSGDHLTLVLGETDIAFALGDGATFFGRVLDQCLALGLEGRGLPG